VVFLSLVATHSDLDLERIGRMSAAAPRVSSSTADSPMARGVVVLSTCNRFEVYTEVTDTENVEALRSEIIGTIAEESGLPERTVASSMQTIVGNDVAHHLFAVGAGLDSAVVGEREIAGQVRRSLVTAQAEGTASGGLTKLFQTATRTAKDVGSKTALGTQGKSIVSVGLDLVDQMMHEDHSFSESAVVVFGTGAYAGATMALLRERGVADISVYSQSGRAPEFTAARGGTALADDELEAAMARADVIIGCSGGDRRISAEEIRTVRGIEFASADRVDRELYVLDLALTHDFDPDIVDLPGVELLTLESIRLAAPQEAASALEAAREIVAKSAEEFIAERTAREVDSAVVALRQHTLAVLDRELTKVRAQHGCTAAGEEVEFALRRMVKQLLHIPTVRGRELAAQGRADEYISAIEALYGVTVERPAVPAARPSRDSDQGDCPLAHTA
jgi:glutamyl-tRNA reductase